MEKNSKSRTNCNWLICNMYVSLSRESLSFVASEMLKSTPARLLLLRAVGWRYLPQTGIKSTQAQCLPDIAETTVTMASTVLGVGEVCQKSWFRTYASLTDCINKSFQGHT